MKNNSRYTKEILEKMVKESKCVTEIKRKIGGDIHSIRDKIKEYNLDISHFVINGKINYSSEFINIIQLEYNSGISWKDISIKYSITLSKIIRLLKSKILIGKTRSEVLKDFNLKNNTYYNDEFIKMIQTEYNKGLYWSEISRKYKIARSTICEYIKSRKLISMGIKESNKLRKNIPELCDWYKTSWTKERRQDMSEQKIKLYKEHPEKHPLYKIGRTPEKLSYPERITYRFLEELGIEFKPQEPVGGYWLDFLIEGKLDLEIDGEFWHKNRKEQDSKRDTLLENMGYTVIRIPAKMVYDNLKELFKSYNKNIILDLNKIKNELIIIKRTDIVESKNIDKNTDISNYENINIRKKKKNLPICNCGNIISNKKSKWCMECFLKIPRKTKFNISKEELDILIQNNPIETIGKIFGVSGTAIKKRCIKFGIYNNRKYKKFR